MADGTAKQMMDRVVDVRDIARAHVLAAELPHASGRYLVSNGDTSGVGLLYEALGKRFPQYSYPSVPYEVTPFFDNSKVGPNA